MSIQSIYDDINFERITFGPHFIQRLWENGLSIEQILDVVLTGTVRKKERDEYSGGKFSKYTIVKGNTGVVIKDCRPAFIITVYRR